MRKLFSFIKNGMHFITNKMWQIRLNKLDRKQSFLIKQLRILTLAIKGFNEKKCLVKASALTYYMLFAIVPLLALLFAVAKGFGSNGTGGSEN